MTVWHGQEEEVVTTGYKWLRAVGRTEFTGLHTDRVFLGRGASRRLLPDGTPRNRVCAHLHGYRCACVFCSQESQSSATRRIMLVECP